jgi:hypothetical protein
MNVNIFDLDLNIINFYKRGIIFNIDNLIYIYL